MGTENIAFWAVKTQPDLVVSHWHRLIEGLSASSTAFYDSLQVALETRAVPDAVITRVEYAESGLLSAKRLYLHISRGREVIDVCAAPFGTGFFISFWLATTRPAFPVILRVAALLALFPIYFVLVLGMGLVMGTLVFWGSFMLTLFAVSAATADTPQLQEFVLAVPIVGRIYERLFIALTYYELDSAFMFRDAVHNAVLDTVDGLTNQHGIRALTDAERKPIQRDIFQARGR